MTDILKQREKQVHLGSPADAADFDMKCETLSVAGSVSQRACVFCGSRVVLYPIADALHLVHGPVGCAAYTWDIRGSMSSGPQLHRMSFSTDLREQDVIFGGEKKLYAALTELIDAYRPKAAFVYSTCIVGLIGDDVEAVCRRVAAEKRIPVLPVHSEGFKGTKKDGYKAACDALLKLIADGDAADLAPRSEPLSLNILGEFNLAGEAWIIRDYYERMGLKVVATMTGDGRIADVRRSHTAMLNVVQCSGSMIHLARDMEAKFGIPYLRVSYFGLEDMARALYDVADAFPENPEVLQRTRELVRSEVAAVVPELKRYAARLSGRRAAVYVGGAFKTFSMVRSLRTLGVKTVIAGSQTGNRQDYELLRELCDPDTVLLDDTNPLELVNFIRARRADMLIGGVKERPISAKLGLGFVDHNHERKIPLAGFEGMLNFAREVHASVNSPVWRLFHSADGPTAAAAAPREATP